MACLALLILPGAVQADINWRVSVKFILNASGNRPTGAIDTDQEVQDQIDIANEVLNAMGRGYKLQLTEIVDVSGISQWYTRDVCDQKTALDDAARANTSLYEWSNNAINIYINDDSGPGCCSFPGSGDDVIFIGQGLRTTTFIHEIGHFMDLCHTQGCPCGSCDNTKTGVCHTVPGNDNISDTLADLSCWTQDQISQNAFGNNYSSLTSSQQTRVDNVFNNIMSYHNTRNRFTSDQLDVATDISNDSRSFVASGLTRLVDDANNCLLPLGNRFCILGVGGPFPTVLQGINASSSADIVLIKGGTYNEGFTSNRPVTLRATRGSAVIAPGLSAFTTLNEPLTVEAKLPDTFDGRTGR